MLKITLGLYAKSVPRSVQPVTPWENIWSATMHRTQHPTIKCSINNLYWFRDIWGARLFDQGQDDCGLWRVWFQVHRMQLQLSEWQKHEKPHRIPPCVFLWCPVQLVSESLSHQGSLKKAHQSGAQIYRIKHFLKGMSSTFQAPVTMRRGRLCLKKSCNWTRLHLAARIVRTNQTEGPMLQGMWKDTTLAISVLHVCTVVKHLLPIMPLALMFQESTEIQNKHLCDFTSLFWWLPFRKRRVPKSPGACEFQDRDSGPKRVQMHWLWACL